MNEYIASRLAGALGVLCPPGDVAELSGGAHAYAVLAVFDQGQTPAPADLKTLAQRHPHEAAGILVMDEWIMNADRHDDNVIWWPKIAPHAIDHADAFLGHRSGVDPQLVADRAVTRSHPFRGHVTAARVKGWAQRVQAVPPQAVVQPVQSLVAWGLLHDDEAQRIIYLLQARQQHIVDLLERAGWTLRRKSRRRTEAAGLFDEGGVPS